DQQRGLEAGEVERLAAGCGGDAVFACFFGNTQVGDELTASKGQGRMDLVADHKCPVPGHDPGEFDECLPAVHQTDRVVWAAQQYTSGSGSKGAIDPVQVEGVGVTVVQQRHLHDAAAAFGNKVVEGRVDRWGDDDPGAGWKEMTQRLHDDHTDIGGAPHPRG